MRSTIDSAGRIVIPAEIRRRAGLSAGMQLEVTARDGEVVIEPAPLTVRLERRGRFVVAVPDTRGVPPLARDVIEKTREQVSTTQSPR